MKERLVVIGNGMAGMRVVEEVLKRDPRRYDITVFGAEGRVNYNRIMLSPVLAGEKEFDDIVIHDRAWYEDNSITLHAGDPVERIDRSTKTVHSRDGLSVTYDKLLLATGSSPFILPVPGRDLEGVVTFRDMDDVGRMLDASRRYDKAVVIGGGLLGLEAAYGLSLKGMDVTVVHLFDTLMERQLDEAAGYLLRRELENRGIAVMTGADTQEIIGDGRVRALRLKDGREIEADLVVMAVGIRPDTALAAAAGLRTERGIVVDDGLCTDDPDILAVGECVEHRGVTYGLVAPLYDMARILAARLTGDEDAVYTGSQVSTRLKVSGVEVFSAGDITGGEGTEDVTLRDATRGIYRRLILRDNVIEGIVMYGDTSDSGWYLQLLRDRTDIGAMRDTLIFGQAFADGSAADAGEPGHMVAALPDNAEICGCNGVCKGEIVAAISTKGLSTLEEVRAHTKASASCGSCTGLVEQLLALSLGGEYEAVTEKPLCSCTALTHDDLRRLILARGLKSIPEVLQECEWRTPNGCATCRPALNYYLLCAWPGEYVDDARSRFINERIHANIQRDGTYSVVPRMWGGLTNAHELRAIADVVEKYDIPTVKVTGGQRIDLLGVQKQDLPGVWADLNRAGMVSGHAYGKSLRTVKTCVGKEWCRFGTQMSMSMGVTLERMCWGSWTPHKVKLAVSGCPRNCAEATIKDFGVIAVDSGWELYVGGNGGMKLRGAELLCKVETPEEVKEYCGAFLQLYREQAHYLERTAAWIERVGLDFVKSAVVEDEEKRAALHRRFLHSQKFMQKDPWAARAHGREWKEFVKLAVVA